MKLSTKEGTSVSSIGKNTGTFQSQICTTISAAVKSSQ